MKSITSYIQERTDATHAKRGLERAELLSILDGVGAFTLFLPTDDAFKALSQEQRDEIEDDEDVCDDIFMYHVIQGSYTLDDFKEYMAPEQDEVRVPTAQGEDVLVRSAGDEVTINGIDVTEPDIACANGTLHVIAGLLRPPSMLPRSATAGSPRFEVMTGEKHVRFRMRLSTGEVVAVSKGYLSKEECLGDIQTIRRELTEADIIEVDDAVDE